jgi:hypothetical protein
VHVRRLVKQKVSHVDGIPNLVLRLLASEFEVPVSITAKCKVKCKLRKQWLAARFNKCFGTLTGIQPVTKKMNNKKAATHKDSYSFEDSARSRKFRPDLLSHSHLQIHRPLKLGRDRSDFAFPRGMEAVALSGIEVG